MHQKAFTLEYYHMQLLSQQNIRISQPFTIYNTTPELIE